MREIHGHCEKLPILVQQNLGALCIGSLHSDIRLALDAVCFDSPYWLDVPVPLV
jgi:hypothetical protein